MKVVLSTRNAHKLQEVQRILAAEAVAGVEVVGLDGFDVPEVVEDGVSFAENALLKAEAAARATGLPAIADDSGIAVDALNGMPGIFSARWAGTHGDDQANLDLLLAQVADVPDARRGASFVCAAALVRPDGSRHVEEGVVRGTLLRARRGEGGFGYDPVFVPEGHELSTAEMSPAAKDAISHRGRAFRALSGALRTLARS
ncbi:XTP/dITP diphosphohydrolase [Motilibacter peucedani]|uniref:dITP/XTP pyrophosphatase n=1 Tax=Motilibacter peucedani TaxID=598650 RepID=A0A420XNA6_9ACTN|nr:RdgB/HAM1 family non-canonical purine NTP pyrophosphatase [Motilibacter peucedani]RKS72767.1 XTP/dITP diphosphohydrolase [Motilibacter peucedani]